MNREQIEQVLKLVTNNETAEEREAALGEAARLLKQHLGAARAAAASQGGTHKRKRGRMKNGVPARATGLGFTPFLAGRNAAKNTSTKKRRKP
jgi:RecA/RadA recombinase